MGSFSWLKADRLTKTANVYYGCPFKFLIPKEFGGGFIKDHYQDYGNLGWDSEKNRPKYDMYEILVFWNSDMARRDGSKIIDYLNWEGRNLGAPMPLVKTVDEFTGDNRSLGIDIGCYDVDMMKLKYPLKLVSPRNSQTYEECEGISLGDPHQGFYKVSWERIDKEYQERVNSLEMSIKQQVEEIVQEHREFITSINNKQSIEDRLSDAEIEELIIIYEANTEKRVRERTKL
jgi:hypothetical protein